MRKTILIALVTALTAWAGLALGAERQTPPRSSGIRYVSQQRILAESVDARAEFARLQQFQQQKTSEVRTLQQELDATRRELAQAREPAVVAELQSKEARQRAEAERASAQAQTDVQALQRQIQSALQSRLKTVLDELLRGQDVQIVLSGESAVVWAAPGADLTSAVIERMNLGRAPVQ